MAAEHRGLPVSRSVFVQGVGIAGLGLLAGCGWGPGQGHTEQPVQPRIGFLTPSPAEAAQPYVEALRQGLREWGWVEHEQIGIEYRFADGRDDRVEELAADLVRANVRVIVTEGGPTTHVAKRITATTPIVFGVAADPVGTGLVASIAHPGGNVTGLMTFSPELAGKRLELLGQLTPTLARVAVLWNAASADRSRELAETEAAAQMLGIRVQPLPVWGPEDLEKAFERARHEQTDALMTLGDPLTVNQRAHIVALAARPDYQRSTRFDYSWTRAG